MPTRRLMGTATSSSVPDNGGDHSGGGGSGGGYVDDVFSTYLYEGDQSSSARTIVNGIDLKNEGGMVWIKIRSRSKGNYLFDTERGAGKPLSSNETSAESAFSNGNLNAFNNDGFDIGDSHTINETGHDIVSWTFRKAPKFFDVVTYTGDGVMGREIPHNLGCEPGMIIVKSTSGAHNWSVYSRGSNGGVNPENYNLVLNDTAAQVMSNAFWANTAPTSTAFSVGTSGATNHSSGETYVAYLFAHDDSDESMIKCGSYTGNGNINDSTAGVDVELGWEPQWVLIKAASGTGAWYLQDTMRGLGSANLTQYILEADSAKQEDGPGQNVLVTPTGFRVQQSSSGFNGNGEEYIYMAIRRPNKPAEEFDPEELFNTVPGRSDGKSPSYVLGLPPDMAIQKAINGSADGHYIFSRPTGNALMFTNANSTETTGSSVAWDYMDGVMDYFASSAYNAWGWRRAPGFFDAVAYEGDGVAGREIPHNLAVKPEMMWVKHRKDVTVNQDWVVYSEDLGAEHNLFLNENHSIKTNIEFNNTEPTDTHFTVSSQSRVNRSGAKYIAYLFASAPGVSKVGSYSGTGAEIDVDCGFTTGARFVLIKRTDQVGDWYFWDTERGITSSRCNYLLLNTTAAQVTNTNYIELLSIGFKVTASAPDAINASGGEYIFYAIA